MRNPTGKAVRAAHIPKTAGFRVPIVLNGA